jgi:hypothetical protein
MYASKIRQDVQFQNFAAGFAEKIKGKAREGKVPLGLHLLHAQLAVLKGELVAASGDTPDASTKTGLYIAAAMSDDEFQESLKRSSWLQMAAKEPIETVKSIFRRVEIIQSIKDGGTPEAESIWQAHLNKTLLQSTDHAWIEQCIVALQKSQPTEPTGNKISIKLPLGEMIRTSLLNKKDPAERHQAEALQNALGLLGIGRLLVDLEIQGPELVIDSNLEVSDLGKGLFSILDTTPGDFPEDRLVLGNASSFVMGKINLLRFWQTLPEIMAAGQPDAGERFNMALTFYQNQSGVDFEQDLLEHVGKPFVLATAPVDEKQALVAALELADGRAINTAISRIFTSPLAQAWAKFITVSDFKGHAFYSSKQSGSDSKQLALSTTDTHLLLGDADLVRETIQRLESESSAQTNPLLLTAQRHAPGNAFGIGATDHQKTISMLNVKVSDSSFSAGFGFVANQTQAEAKTKLEPNEISFNYMASFLQNACYFTEKTERGIHHRILFWTKQTEGV